ncbi:MAG: hypothetical protein AVDCRST_MAG39-1734, partial [uncultured Sphingomonadaceae bacterium]
AFSVARLSRNIVFRRLLASQLGGHRSGGSDALLHTRHPLFPRCRL